MCHGSVTLHSGSPQVQRAHELRVPLFRPDLGANELDALREVFASGWVGLGPKTAEFERALAAYQQRLHGVATNSATAALHLALKVLDLPPGSRVLVPTVTFVSTPHAVEYNQLELEFVDVREADLDLTGRHARGDVLTIEGFFHRITEHRRQHAQELAKNLGL